MIFDTPYDYLSETIHIVYCMKPTTYSDIRGIDIVKSIPYKYILQNKLLEWKNELGVPTKEANHIYMQTTIKTKFNEST